MDEKISLEAISLYADAYSEKVLKGFFSSKEKINGQEILALCNVQQINLFIVRELFRSWKEETRKLKSSYFDYEHPDVKEALENFMGVLSRNISIGQAYFSPLLKKSVSQTLMVIFDPYDFFSMLMTGKNNKLDVATFREEIKYLKVNKAPLERLLERLEEKKIEEISGNEAFSYLDQILEEVNFTPEDVDDYIEKFSSVLPLDPAQFYVTKTPETFVVAPTPVQVQEVKKPEPPPTPRVNQPKANVVAQHVQQVSTSLNDKLGNAPRASMIDNLQKIIRIKDSLTINQKFMFTKVLFHGDFELFSKAIDDLDRQDNIKGAMRYLEDNYGDWDQESEEFHEFMELVERRFS
ncbi:MAG TPA: hypothetical protein VIM65_24155 [Cyclobacteriaceae bacterium]